MEISQNIDLQNLDNYISLSLSFTNDYWSDDGILHAHDLISKLTDESWNKLTDFWQLKDNEWISRLAAILPFGDQESAAKILYEIVISTQSSNNLKTLALDSLRDTDIHMLEKKELNRLLDEIEMCRKWSSPIEHSILDLLKKYIKEVK